MREQCEGRPLCLVAGCMSEAPVGGALRMQAGTIIGILPGLQRGASQAFLPSFRPFIPHFRRLAPALTRPGLAVAAAVRQRIGGCCLLFGAAARSEVGRACSRPPRGRPTSPRPGLSSSGGSDATPIVRRRPTRDGPTSRVGLRCACAGPHARPQRQV
eukprot:366537-Chlamydomonas_euryale.AAC.10